MQNWGLKVICTTGHTVCGLQIGVPLFRKGREKLHNKANRSLLAYVITELKAYRNHGVKYLFLIIPPLSLVPQGCKLVQSVSKSEDGIEFLW
jgi:hypothetical protein